MSKYGYSNRPVGYANSTPTARFGFIPGTPGRECRECFAVGGHYSHCDKCQ